MLHAINRGLNDKFSFIYQRIRFDKLYKDSIERFCTEGCMSLKYSIHNIYIGSVMEVKRKITLRDLLYIYTNL